MYIDGTLFFHFLYIIFLMGVAAVQIIAVVVTCINSKKILNSVNEIKKIQQDKDN